jgi:uncharacterized membrane protein
MNSEAVSTIPAKPRPRSAGRAYSVWALWALMMLLATMIAVVSARYFFWTPPTKPTDKFTDHFAHYFPMLLPHIIGGVGALLIGPWQFASWLRDRYLNLHRWLGRIYLIAVLLGSTAGMAMATVSEGGLATHTGFGMLAGLWFLTGALAYRHIRRGDLVGHKQWMIRNYSLTFAAVTLRLWFPFLAGVVHIDPMDAYITVSWLCWVPNLIVAEIIATRVKAAA